MRNLKLGWIVVTLLGTSALTARSASAEGPGGASNNGVYFEITGAPVYNQALVPGADALNPPEDKPLTSLGYDSRTSLGYRFNSWLFIGGTLNYSRVPEKQDAAPGLPGDPDQDGTDRKVSKLEYGPTLGFFFDNFRLMGTLIVGGSKTVNDRGYVLSGNTTLDTRRSSSVGLGYQILLGYSFAVGSHLKIGPALLYRHVNYKDETFSNRLDPSGDYVKKAYDSRPVEGSLVPMVTLGWQF